MRDTFLKSITDDQRNILYDMIELEDEESCYRAKIILLKDEGCTVPEVKRDANHHNNKFKKWLHRFNEKGIDEKSSKIHKHKPIMITGDI